jgi:uncharacterized protein YbjT (DUF2867 family)
MVKDATPIQRDRDTVQERPLILLTGATGYVGGRLLTQLEEAGYRVRCLTRRPEELTSRIKPGTETTFADMLDPASLPEAMRGGDTAFYLVHSMGAAKGFEEKDRLAALNFGKAAHLAGVRRIIYLGGLGEESQVMSEHLRSRQEVGSILRESGVEVIEFRASIVIGSGSLSFEMVRALVERLPVMITPRWVAVTAQPISIEDLLAYLLAAVTHPTQGSRIYEIGGADQVSYGDIMREYARQRGLRRLMIPVPILSPRLSSLWLGLITPVYSRVGRKLINSIRNPTVVRDQSALRMFPIRPMGISAAIARAIRNEDQEIAASRWSDALSAGGEHRDWTGVRFGNRLVDSRTATVEAGPEQAFAPIARIGGKTGWYGANGLWLSRGFIDLLVGGVGVRRGRRDPERLRVGDTVDWWRVEIIEPARRLRLVAEMRLPGRAWLEFEVRPGGDRSTIQQTAIFDPVGLSGLAYWYLLYPIHHVIFSRMLRNIVAAAEKTE